MKISGIEVIQTIQDLENSVPLIKSKRTFARVHVQGNIQAKGLAAHLSGLDLAGNYLGPPLIPSNLGGLIDLKLKPDRGQRDESFYFELPIDWTRQDALKLKAEINTNQIVNESDYSNNILTTKLLELRSNKEPKVRVVRYRHKLVDMPDEFWERSYNELLTSLLIELPVPSIAFSSATFVDAQEIGNIPKGVELAHLINWQNTYEPNSKGVFYYALGDFFGGVAKLGQPNDNLWYGVGNSAVSVHEFGHMLGLAHVNGIGQSCSKPENIDVNYPYPDGRIGGAQNELNKYFGLNPVNPQIGFPNLVQIIPAAAWDKMTYCNPKWFSDWSTRKMLNYIEQNSNIALAVPEKLIPTELFASINDEMTYLDAARFPKDYVEVDYRAYQEGDFLTVYGTIDTINKKVLSLRISREPMVGTIPEVLPGPYRIQLIDSFKNIIAEHKFSLIPIQDASASGLIALVIPFITNTKTIVILSNNRLGHELASLSVSENIPVVNSVEVFSQGMDDLEVRWKAGDADQDSLSYTVLYSADEKITWQALAMGVRDKQLKISKSDLKASKSKNSSFLRVIAHDGVLTDQADSHRLNVENKPPKIIVISPKEGATFVSGQVISFHAIGTDLEDDNLADSAYTWTSDRDGRIGQGKLISTRQLSEGPHIVTIAVTDSHGKTTSRKISIEVNSGKTPLIIQCAYGKGKDFVLGGYGQDGEPWSMKVSEVKAMIKSGRSVYSADSLGNLARVKIITDKRGREYLRSVKTKVQTDNLLMLPVCR